MSLTNILNQLKYGTPVIIVSGLPRSGTSMMMKMLSAGGLEIVSDGERGADVDNPEGYFEYERVKDLDKPKDAGWVVETRGKVLKVISFLLRHLPSTCRYKIIFMRREIDEVIASQNKMLVNRGEPVDPDSDAVTRKDLEAHLQRVEQLFGMRSNFEVLQVAHRDVIENPLDQARIINRFLGGRLDVEKMASVVDPELYRTKAVKVSPD